MKKRRCVHPGCITILGSTNTTKLCWTHTPDIGPKLTGKYKPVRVTSEKFLGNIAGAYNFTAAERRRYKEGG